MQTIQIEQELYRDIIKYGIDIQAELKQIIANFLEKKQTNSYLDSQEFQEDKRYFQGCLKDIESGKNKLLDQEQYYKEMNIFEKELRTKYANN